MEIYPGSMRQLLTVLRAAGPDRGWLIAAGHGSPRPDHPCRPAVRSGPRWRRRTPDHRLDEVGRRRPRHRGPYPSPLPVGRWRTDVLSRRRYEPGLAR
jgi:hypothetical protein